MTTPETPYGPNSAAVSAYLAKLPGLTPEQWTAARTAARDAARAAAWTAAWAAARDAARDAAWTAAWTAEALVVRDLITPEQFDILVAPMRAAGIDFPGTPVDDSILDGATTPPPEGAYASDGGEFAARWNALTPEQRDEAAHAWQGVSRRAIECVAKDHDGLTTELETIRGLHLIATDNAARLRSAAEEALRQIERGRHLTAGDELRKALGS